MLATTTRASSVITTINPTATTTTKAKDMKVKISGKIKREVDKNHKNL